MIENQQPSHISSDQQQQQILLPMCNLFPANQIITKKYQPDNIPVMKLITRDVYIRKQQKSKAYNFDQPKLNNVDYVDYTKMFGCNDTLGAYYADKADQIVYMKFNNKDYNLLKVGEKRLRYFAGLFVDMDNWGDINKNSITNNTSKQPLPSSSDHPSSNIYKSLSLPEFVDYNPNILQSFGKNTKGCMWDPKFSSNYDSANLFAAVRVTYFLIIDKTVRI